MKTETYNLIIILSFMIVLAIFFLLLITTILHTERIVQCAENNKTYFEYSMSGEKLVYCGDVGEFLDKIKAGMEISK